MHTPELPPYAGNPKDQINMHDYSCIHHPIETFAVVSNGNLFCIYAHVCTYVSTYVIYNIYIYVCVWLVCMCVYGVHASPAVSVRGGTSCSAVGAAAVSVRNLDKAVTPNK